MPKLSSQHTIKRLAKKFGKRYRVTVESKNRFGFDSAIYEPDLVFRNKRNDTIKAVIEVEQGTRKHVIGGVMSADYCMRKLKQKPIMCVLALTEQDRKDYLKRAKMLSHYVRHLKRIVIGNQAEITKVLDKMK